MTDLVGTTLGQYQVVELIGEGGMASVYKAWQPSLRRYVALKVLAPHLDSDAEFIKRFQQEAVSAANLKHTGIVTIHDVGAEGGYHYIAMEFIEGTSLEERVRSGQAFPPEQVVEVISQVGSALDYAHQRGFIHRDIKPANVLIDQGGRAVLTDFGIAKALSGSGVTAALTRSGTIFGTPHYMSPEQVREEDLDHRSDLYSLGIVCYEMLSGEVPFDGTTTHSILYAQANNPPPPLREVNPAIPPAVEAVVTKMLDKERERRYDSGGQFARELAQAVAGAWPEGIGEEMAATEEASVVAAGRGGAPAVARPARRSRLPLVLGALAVGVLLIAGAVVGVMVLGRKGESELEKAQAALATGDYVGAAVQFEGILDGEPGNVEALDGLLGAADGLAQAGEHNQAIVTFKQVLEWDADNAEALKGIGEAYEAQEQWQQAANWYEQWTQMAPDDAKARLGLGWAHYRLKEYENAVAQFSRVTGLRADWPEGFEGLGKSYYQLGDFEKAVDALEKWSELEPASVIVHYFLGTSLYNMSRYQEAVEPLEAFVQSNPTEEVHKRLGWTYFYLKRYEDAINHFSEALQLNESAGAYRGLGNSYYQLKRCEDAGNAFSRWAALEPDNATAYRLLGLSRYCLGEYEMAIEAFNNSLQLEENAGSYRGLGLSYEKLQDYQEAAHVFEQWIKLSPDEGEAHLLLGWAYFFLKRHSDAIPMFQRAIELESDIADAYRGLGASHVALGDHKNALVAYERWSEVDAENAQAFRAVGWEYLALQRPEEAVLAFTRSIQLEEHAGGYYGLAEAYRRQGDCEKARPNYEKAIELKPDDTTIKAGLEKCQ